MPAKKTYDYYLKLLEERKGKFSLQELIKLRLEIEASGLTTKEKKSLIDARIAKWEKEIIPEDKKLGKEEAKIRLEKLRRRRLIDRELHKYLTDYLLTYAPEMVYGSGYTYRTYVVPIITRFIEFIAKREGKQLGVKDLDDTVLSQTDLTAYLVSVSDKPAERNKHRKILMTFRKWLYDSPARVRLPFYPERKEEKPMKETVDSRKGYALKPEEIEKILAATKGIRAPANEYYEIYFRLLLAAGLRPDAGLVYRVEDIMGGVPVKGSMGYDFVQVECFTRIREMKRLRGEWIHGKRPPDYIYLPIELRDMIDEYVQRHNLDEGDYLIPVKIGSAEEELGRLRKRLNMPDLSLYCFRNTWASVVYVVSGYNVGVVEELGGWRESGTVLKHYKTTIKVEWAAEIFQKYKIYIPEEYEGAVKATLAGIKGMTDEEEERSIRALEEKIEFLMKEMEKLKRGG